MRVLIRRRGVLCSQSLGRPLSRAATRFCLCRHRRDGKVRHLQNEHAMFHLYSRYDLQPRLDRGLSSEGDRLSLAAVVGVEHYVGGSYEDPPRQRQRHAERSQSRLQDNKKVVFSSTSEVYGRNPKCRGARTTIACSGRPISIRWCYRPRRRPRRRTTSASPIIGRLPVNGGALFKRLRPAA